MINIYHDLFRPASKKCRSSAQLKAPQIKTFLDRSGSTPYYKPRGARIIYRYTLA